MGKIASEISDSFLISCVWYEKLWLGGSSNILHTSKVNQSVSSFPQPGLNWIALFWEHIQMNCIFVDWGAAGASAASDCVQSWLLFSQTKQFTNLVNVHRINLYIIKHFQTAYVLAMATGAYDVCMSHFSNNLVCWNLTIIGQHHFPNKTWLGVRA